MRSASSEETREKKWTDCYIKTTRIIGEEILCFSGTDDGTDPSKRHLVPGLKLNAHMKSFAGDIIY